MEFSTFVFVTLLNLVNSSKILVIFPFPSPSHYILGSALARSLAEDGHDVTMVSPFQEKDLPKNGSYRDIALTSILEDHKKNIAINMFTLENMSPFLGLFFLSHKGTLITQKVFDHPKFQELLNSKEHFDVVIVESFVSDALYGVANHFNAPLIKLSTVGPNPWLNPSVGNPAPPSYIPATTLEYSSDMTLLQRLVNWLFIFTCIIERHLIFLPAQNKIIKKYLPNVPDLNIVDTNASIVLVNYHESIDQAVPTVPSMIPIGGFHVRPSKELPKDLKEFMDSATEGVVYFSLGSNIKPSDMPEDKRAAILKALGKVKQKVLWKWDEDVLSGKPDNVKLSKWFPQQDILAHPNTKLFITHGGLLSTTETIYHGVPTLAFPIFGDQKMIAARAEISGFGISLQFSELTEEQLTSVLEKLLNDPKYRENAKKLSKVFHDRPIHPMGLAKFWVEFVIRHKGAAHLKVAGVELPWYIYFSLDVMFFIAFVVISVISILYFIFKRMFVCFKKNKVKVN